MNPNPILAIIGSQYIVFLQKISRRLKFDYILEAKIPLFIHGRCRHFIKVKNDKTLESMGRVGSRVVQRVNKWKDYDRAVGTNFSRRVSAAE